MIPVPPWRLPAPSLDAQRRLQGDSSIPHTPPRRQRHEGTGTIVLTVAMTFPVLLRFPWEALGERAAEWFACPASLALSALES